MLLLLVQSIPVEVHSPKLLVLNFFAHVNSDLQTLGLIQVGLKKILISCNHLLVTQSADRCKSPTEFNPIVKLCHSTFTSKVN